MSWPPRLAAAALVLGGSVLLASAVRTVLAVRMLEAGAFSALLPWAASVAIYTVAVLALMCVLSGATTSGRWPRMLPATLAASATAMFILVIPPGEGPDELAHLQYTRYFAVTGTLPSQPGWAVMVPVGH